MYRFARVLRVSDKLVSRKGGAVLRRSLADVDVSSPLNPLLDTESQGRFVRDTSFSIFPSEPLDSLLFRLASESRHADFLANLIQRAIDVSEEQDTDKREAMRKQFQSAVYLVHVNLLSRSTGDGYSVFQLYNRNEVSKIAAKVHADKFEIIEKLITQPLLRIVAYNQSIVLDPNEVMRMTGVDGFRSIMDLFLLDLMLLSGRNLSRLIGSMRSKHKSGQPVHFELLHVWFRVWDDSFPINKPVKAGCPWTMEKVLVEVIKKQSKDMLVALLARSGNARDALVQVCRRRHSITGTPKYPWANDLVDSWMIEMRQGLSSENNPLISASVAAADDVRLPAPRTIDNSFDVFNVAESSNPDETTFVITADSQLGQVKAALKNAEIIGLSFPSESVLSISSQSGSFVIDLKSVKPVFVAAVVRQVLNRPETPKVVYSMESFLDRMQTLLGFNSGVHFENLIDLRRGRIRRSLQVGASTGCDVPEVSLPGVLDPESVSGKNQLTEKCEYFYSRTPLMVMAQEILGVPHDRKLAFDESVWEYRPLSEALIRFSARDSMVLIDIESRLRAQRMQPLQTLSYDPFIS